MPSRRHLALLAAFVAVVGALAALNAIRFASAGHDDTFIMLWSGRTFGLRSGFHNFNFEPQEISSSWIGAWSGSLAYLIAPTRPLLAYKLLAALAGLACVAVLWPARARLFGDRSPELAAVVAAALTLLSPTFGYWVHGGLETPYQSLGFICWVIAAERYFTRGTATDAAALASASIFVVLARTEGFWILGALVALAWIARAKAPTRRTAITIAIVAATFALTLVIRRALTGALWPNPVYAKLDTLPNNVGRGLDYVWQYARSGPLAVAHLVGLAYGGVIVAGALRGRTTPIAVVACALLSLGQTAFTIAAGGNWMEYYRFLAPTVLLNTILLLHLLGAGRGLKTAPTTWSSDSKASQQIPILPLAKTPLAPPVCGSGLQTATARRWNAGVAVLALAAFTQAIRDQGAIISDGTLQLNCAFPLELSTRRGEPLATWLDEELIEGNCAHGRDAYMLQPFIDGKLAELVAEAGTLRIATAQMGYLPFFIRRRFGVDQVRFIDTMGLNDRAIALAPAPRDSVGLSDGYPLAHVLSGEGGAVSRAVEAQAPNAGYEVKTDAAGIAKLRRAGFELVWDQPRAKVFFRR